MTAFKPFLAAFCRMMSDRRLQHKFGLKFKSDDEPRDVGWTAYELPQKRATIMLRDGMPKPEGEVWVDGVEGSFRHLIRRQTPLIAMRPR